MQTHHERDRQPLGAQAVSSQRSRAVGAPGLLGLQSAAGNRAVAALIAQRSSVDHLDVQREGWSSSSPSSGGGPAVEEAGGGGGPATAATTAQVDVRATKITALRGMPVYHLFIVYQDAAGHPSFFRGGPSGAGGAAGYGNIKCTHGPYVPGTVDWAPGAPSETVATEAAASGKDATFQATLGRIDGAGIAYDPTGPNSNSVVRTLLSDAALPARKPVWIAPGWDEVL